MLKTAPAVFAVNDTYQIFVPVTSQSLMWIRVDGECYYDESNGIMRSLSDLHKVTVPMDKVDKAGKYTVCIRPIVERKPYFTETEAVREYEFSFRPLPRNNVRIYHISDAHNRIIGPVAAAKAFGNIDLLLLNGDVIDHSGDPSKFDNVYEICSQLTGGNIPVVFSRGNHDMRGNYAEKFAEYTPNSHGNTYYTFRLGSLWGILLDCGEDKEDGHEEYGYTVCCTAFRKRQTEFLKKVIADAENEYAAEGVTTRLVISHNPFTHQLEDPFDIETERYTEWAKLLKEHVKPHLMICGHFHTTEVRYPGESWDHLGQPCPIVVGAMPLKNDGFVGCGMEIGKDRIKVEFTDHKGNTVQEDTIIR